MELIVSQWLKPSLSLNSSSSSKIIVDMSLDFEVDFNKKEEEVISKSISS